MLDNAFFGPSFIDSDDSNFEVPQLPKKATYTPIYVSSSEVEMFLQLPFTSKGKRKCKGKEKLHDDDRIKNIQNHPAKFGKGLQWQARSHKKLVMK